MKAGSGNYAPWLCRPQSRRCPWMWHSLAMHCVFGYVDGDQKKDSERIRRESYCENALGQPLTATTYVAGDASLLLTYSYAYDAAHRLRKITDSRGNKTLTSTYSAGGRLNLIWPRRQRRPRHELSLRRGRAALGCPGTQRQQLPLPLRRRRPAHRAPRRTGTTIGGFCHSGACLKS